LNKRLIYVDALRAAATFFVVLLHTAAGNLNYVKIGSFEWNVFNFYDSISRFGVPVFVMISGMFLLNPNKDVSLRDIYRKYIFRIVKSFVFWSLLYALYTNVNNYDSFNSDIFVKNFISGHYHLWYLYMIVGLYAITPILRKIAADKEVSRYFLLLSLIFVFILPMIIKSFNVEFLEMIIKKFDFHIVLGYASYYLGGYYLRVYNIKKGNRKVIYILGILGAISTVVLTAMASLKTGKTEGAFYSYFSPNVMLVSISVFIFFKYEISKIKFSRKSIAAIETLSNCSFGIYLIHDFFNMFFSCMVIDTMNYNPLLSVLATTLLVYCASLLVSYIMAKVPFLKNTL